jgi:Domain of unknown function (DUF222)/HNH endonuclease
MSFEELEHELASLASHLHAGMCRWLELVAEVERRGELAGNTADWLAWRCGLMPRTAREHVRIARRLAELPLLQAAFGRGELSYAKLRALTRIAERERYRRVTTDDAVALQENAYLQWYWDEDGSLVLRGQLAPEDGAVFLQAVESAHQALRERGSAEPRQTNADALVAMAELALSGGSSSGGERQQVVVHVDESVLADEAEGGCELDDGPSLAPETARRLACDSSVVRVREREGKTLSVGRKTRSVPPSVRRALKRRDRGCRFPGCENRLFVDAHHIRHWIRGGETSLDNLVLLCRRHHRFVHEGGYSVDEELRIRDPWGALVPNAPRPPPGSIEPLLREGVGTYAIAWVDRIGPDLAVQALLAATE